MGGGIQKLEISFIKMPLESELKKSRQAHNLAINEKCTIVVQSLEFGENVHLQSTSCCWRISSLCSIWILNKKVGLHWKTQQKL